MVLYKKHNYCSGYLGLMPETHPVSGTSRFEKFKKSTMSKIMVLFTSIGVAMFLKILQTTKRTCRNIEVSEKCQLPERSTAEVITLRTEAY
jgi:hypothetical protein